MKNNNVNLRFLVREINKRDEAENKKHEEKIKKKYAKKREKFVKHFSVKIIKNISKKRSGLHFYMPHFIDANDILFYFMKIDEFQGIEFAISYTDYMGTHYINWYVTEGI